MEAAAQLADYRRRVILLYLAEPTAGEPGVVDFRGRRDELFRDHPQSALTDSQRDAFGGLSYFDYDPEAVIRTRLEPLPGGDPLEIETGGQDGVIRYSRVGLLPAHYGALTLLWMQGYGAASFCPSATPPPERRPTGRAAT